jgi:hypothetical protein
MSRHHTTTLQFIPTVAPALTIDDDKRELIAIERLFAELLNSGKLSDRGAELNARMTSAISAMHGMLDVIGTQDRAQRSSMAAPIRRWRAERQKIADWLASR